MQTVVFPSWTLTRGSSCVLSNWTTVSQRAKTVSVLQAIVVSSDKYI